VIAWKKTDKGRVAMVDKPDGKKKISIKINGEKTEYEEDIRVHDWKLGTAETAAGEEKLEDTGFDWNLADETPQPPKEYKKINYVNGKKKKNKKSFKNPFQDSINLIMSIIGAVVVGAVLGFGTLKVITNTDGEAAPASTLQDETSAGAAEGNESEGAVKLKEMSTAILQGGVFSTKESLAAMQDTLTSKGISSASIEKDGQWFLLLGVSADVETAKLLGEDMKGNGVDVYAKEFQLGAKEIKASNNEKAFLDKANGLFSILAEESSNGVLNGEGNESAADSIESVLKEIEAIEVKQEQIVKMKESIVNAAKQSISLKSAADAEKVQDQLLGYVETYSNLQ
jgi:stage II sporulation protein B